MATETDFRNAHRTDFGKTLVGSAQVDLNAIQWVGAYTPPTVDINSSNAAFGFTGPVLYQGEGGGANQWQFELASRMVMGGAAPSGGAPAMGLFFAPTTPEPLSATITSSADGFRKQLSVRGEAVEDNPNNPALTLEIDVQGETRSQACGDATLACEDVEMPLEGCLTFVVTPRLNTALLPTGVPNPEYVMIALTAIEKDTQAAGSDFAFRDRCMGNDFTPGRYFQSLIPLGPNQMESSPFRTYAFLVAVNRAFEFYVDNKHPSNAGHIEYQFRIAGHYNFNQPAYWPGSHKTFRVKSTAAAPEWPSLGSGSVMNPVGAVQPAAGVSVNGGVLLIDSNRMLGGGEFVKRNDNVRIGAKVGVFPGLEGQPVDILIVRSHQPNAMTNATFSYKTAAGYQPWTGQPIPTLEAVGHTTLNKPLDINIFEGHFSDEPGIYNYYVGYRITSGAVIFSSTPVNFHVVA